MKKEINKFDGFAIVSFVLSVVFLLFYIFNNGNFRLVTFILLIIFIPSVIFGIISLTRIKSNRNLRGKMFSIIGIVLPSLVLIIMLISAFLIGSV